MLTPRENLLETIRGGTPEYLVNMRHFIAGVPDPVVMDSVGMCRPGTSGKSSWGFTIGWPEDAPGPFPIDAPEDRVITDITKWEEQLHLPDPHAYPDEAWGMCTMIDSTVDRNEKFVAVETIQGIFEKIHCCIGIEDTLAYFLEEPECMHDLIEVVTDWHIELAKEQIARLHPDVLFHSDDFGTQIGTMMSPQVFEEFLLPAYKRYYGFWHDNGIELIMHHNDAWSATLVPYFIEMGMDIWQGPVSENNVPELVKTYGGQISFMGGIDNGKFDKNGWTYESILEWTRKLVNDCGVHYFIPCLTAAGFESTFPGVYEAVQKAINQVSDEILGAHAPADPPMNFPG